MQPAVASRACEWMTSRTRETHSCRPPELHSPEAELRRLAMMGFKPKRGAGRGESVVLTERVGKENEREKERGGGEARGGKTTRLVFASGVTLREGVCKPSAYTNLYPGVRSSSPFVSLLSMNRYTARSF